MESGGSQWVAAGDLVRPADVVEGKGRHSKLKSTAGSSKPGTLGAPAEYSLLRPEGARINAESTRTEGPVENFFRGEEPERLLQRLEVRWRQIYSAGAASRDCDRARGQLLVQTGEVTHRLPGREVATAGWEARDLDGGLVNDCSLRISSWEDTRDRLLVACDLHM